jgi:hypothetical protein
MLFEHRLAPGEYFDMYDIMSAMNVYSTYDPKFQQRGPLLCAANLDRMGWLNSSRVWSQTNANSSWSDTFDLVSMSHPEIPGYLAARINGLYVEFRTQELWDAAIPRPGVLLHINVRSQRHHPRLRLNQTMLMTGSRGKCTAPPTSRWPSKAEFKFA